VKFYIKSSCEEIHVLAHK